jgi:hypothetical protein
LEKRPFPEKSKQNANTCTNALTSASEEKDVLLSGGKGGEEDVMTSLSKVSSSSSSFKVIFNRVQSLVTPTPKKQPLSL